MKKGLRKINKNQDVATPPKAPTETGLTTAGADWGKPQHCTPKNNSLTSEHGRTYYVLCSPHAYESGPPPVALTVSGRGLSL